MCFVLGFRLTTSQIPAPTYRDEEPAHLGQGVGHAGVGLRRRGERGHLDMQVLGEVGELGVSGRPQLLLLGADREGETESSGGNGSRRSDVKRVYNTTVCAFIRNIIQQIITHY